jgi:hypothetical protein
LAVRFCDTLCKLDFLYRICHMRVFEQVFFSFDVNS